MQEKYIVSYNSLQNHSRFDMLTMSTTRILSEIEAEVSNARTRYINSDGEEWLELSLALKAVYETYRAQNMNDKATACYKEYTSVIGDAQGKMVSHLRLSDRNADLFDDSEEIQIWAEKERKSRNALKTGGSPIEYAKIVYALCECLCPSVQSDICPIEKVRLEWAKLKYHEALEALLAYEESKDLGQEQLYMIIVISLKYSECERVLGNTTLARSYSLFPLLYLAQNINKDNGDISSINWDYVASLCKTLINKQIVI